MSNKVNIGNLPNDGTGDSLREFGQKFNNVIENPKFEKMPIIDGTPIGTGYKNIIINGDMTINQRNFNGTSFNDGEFCWDRWEATPSAMTQTIEAGSFINSKAYTLSGLGLPTQVITSPPSGNWRLPEIPRTAREVQLELGTTATPFEVRPIGLELVLCKRYYQKLDYGMRLYTYISAGKTRRLSLVREVEMRAAPTMTQVFVTGGGGTHTSIGTPSTWNFAATGVKEVNEIYVNTATADAEI